MLTTGKLKQKTEVRAVFVLTLLSIVAITMQHDPRLLAGAFAASLGWTLWKGVPLKKVLKRMLLLLPFAFGAIAFIPFTHEGQPLLSIGPLHASLEGTELAASILLKISAANVLITYLNESMNRFELIKHFRWVGMPPVMIEMMTLLMRYFYLLGEEVQSMVRAQKSRGFHTGRLWWRRLTFKRFGELLGMLFIRAYKRSERIYGAMLSRGGVEGMAEQLQDNGKRNKPALELRGVSYRYGEIEALNNISLSIPWGAKLALMGPNGAGKSTLIALLNGLERPEKGAIFFKGERVAPQAEKMLKRSVGVVYQDPDDQIFSATVEEDVAFGPRNLGLDEQQVRERVQTALGYVGMREYGGRSPFELSYGQKRRVAIAGVLAMQPEIMILDEPMAFLDPKGQDDLQTLLESLHLMGITILVATHDVDFAAEWADAVLLLKDGRILAEGSTELLFDDHWIAQAGLHLPRLARPFRLLKGVGEQANPRTARQAAQMIWRLLTHKQTFQSGDIEEIGTSAQKVAGSAEMLNATTNGL